MVKWLRWHCPPDTGFEIRALAVWGRARYLSVTEAPHNTDFHTWMGKKHFLFLSRPPGPGTEPRTLAWKAAVLTTTLGPPPIFPRYHHIHLYEWKQLLHNGFQRQSYTIHEARPVVFSRLSTKNHCYRYRWKNNRILHNQLYSSHYKNRSVETVFTHLNVSSYSAGIDISRQNRFWLLHSIPAL